MILKFLTTVTCVCGHEFETTKSKNIQCRECGRRFDLNSEYLPPTCPVCGFLLKSKIGSSKIICDNCLKEWSLD